MVGSTSYALRTVHKARPLGKNHGTVERLMRAGPAEAEAADFEEEID